MLSEIKRKLVLSRPLKLVACVALAFAVTAAVPAESYGQRSGSRGGGSKSFRSSQPKKTTKPSSSNKGWNKNSSKEKAAATKSAATTDKKSGWGSKKGSTGTRMSKTEAKQKTASEKALHDRAKQNGTHFTDRKSAVNAFKQQKGAEIQQKYPTKFDAPPTKRPDYIPQSTTSNGQTYNITYNQSHGGYGFTNALGAFIVYDMLTDAAFMDRQMQSHNYAYGEPRVYKSSGGGSALFFVAVAIFLIVIAFIIVSTLKK